MYTKDVRKVKEKTIMNKAGHKYEGMVICFTKPQKIELNRYLESVGINYFCYNLATDTGFVFKCDDEPKYSEEFLSYNLHNNVTKETNPTSEIGMISDSLSGFESTEHINQDNDAFKLLRSIKPDVDTKNMNFFYDYGKGDNTNFFVGCAFKQDLSFIQRALKLSQLSNFVSDMLSPLDQLVRNVANPTQNIA